MNKFYIVFFASFLTGAVLFAWGKMMPGVNVERVFSTSEYPSSSKEEASSFSSSMMMPGCAGLAPTEVGGQVWEDWNYNGVMDETPIVGVPDVTVTVYGCDGTVLGTLMTDANGEWSLDVSGAATCNGSNDVRVEYSGLPSWAKFSAVGVNNGSSVQFVAPGNCARLAVGDPDFYYQSAPDMVTSVFRNGLPDPSHSALVKFGYNSSGISQSGITSLATDAEIGSVFGIAYARETQKIYSAAFLRRHVGLKEGLSGNPLGRIFVTNANGGGTSQFINLEDYGASLGSVPTNAARGLAGFTDPSHDDDAYGKIGKVGLGDLDISTDERFLYVISLNEKKLYTIEIDADGNPATPPAQADVQSVAIPDPGCVNGQWRPFALKYYRGDIYIGGVCDGSSNATPDGPPDVNTDMRFYVYKYDGVTFTTLLDEDLDYPKGSTYEPSNTTFDQWFPWNDDNPTYVVGLPQPILSDIEFDGYGAMIIAFADRFGLQRGHQNYLYNSNTIGSEAVLGGDILRAAKDASGNYVLENNASSGGLTGYAPGNGEGPGGGEFFEDVFYKSNSGTVGHSEISYGVLAVHPSNGHVIMNAMDPVNYAGGSDQNYFRAGGPRVLNASNGSYIRGFHIYRDANYGTTGIGKAQGLGDIELLGDPPPIEIGNLVWQDTDNDGVQDPGEPGIAGVTVELVKAGTVIATATTDANGNYIFSSAAGTSTASHIYNISQLSPNMDYVVRLPGTATGGGVLPGPPTSADTGAGGNPDINDSDGQVSGADVEAAVSAADIPIPGANNHSFDFGFISCPPPRCGHVTVVKN